jgi:autotransporter-associated beta strand protein
MRPKALSGSIAKYSRGLALSALALIGAPAVSQAAAYYWNTGTNTWSGTFWSDNATSGGTTGVLPTSIDTITFNQSLVNGAETISLGADRSVLGITFSNTGTTLLQGGGTNRILTIGTSGITINSGAGAVTIGNAAANQNVAVTVNGPQSWANNSATTFTVVNAVTGGANTLTLDGTGNGLTTLTGGLSFSGAGGLVIGKSGTLGTTISGGTITLGGTGGIVINSGASAVGLGANTVSASQSWTNNSATTFTVSGATAAGATTLTLNGAGDGLTTLTGGLTFSGAGGLVIGKAGALGTTISGGTITLGGTGGIVINSGASAVGLGANTVSASQSWTNNSGTTFTVSGATAAGATTLTLDGAGDGLTTLTGGLTFSGAGGLVIGKAGALGTTISGGTITLGGTGGIVINSGASAVGLGANTVSASQSWTNNSATTFTASGLTGVSTGVTLTLGGTGAGLTTLTGGLTTTGTAGLVIGKSGALGTTISGGTITLTGSGGITINSGASAVSLGAATLGVAQTWTNNSSSLFTVSGDITNSTFGLTIAGSGNTTASGVLGLGSGIGGLTKNGTGTLTLTNANLYTGTTTINGGTVTLNLATGSLISTNALTFGGSGTFNMDNTGAGAALAQSLGTLTFSAGDGTVKITNNASQNQTLTFTTLAARGVGATGNFVNTDGTNSATNGIILTGVTADAAMGPGYFFNGGTATANYAFNNAATSFVRGINWGTAEGSTAAGGAIATAGYAQSTGSTTATIATGQVFTGLNFQNTTATAQAVNLAGTITTDGILRSGNGASTTTISGGTSIKTTTAGVDLVIRTDMANDALTISTPILVNGTSGLTKSGAGTLVLSGTNTYNGATYVNGGTLTISSNANLGNQNTGSGNVTVTSSSVNNSNVTISGAAPAGFTIGSSLLGSVVTSISGTAVTLAGRASSSIGSPTSTPFTFVGNSLFLNGATLRTTGNVGLFNGTWSTNNRPIAISNGATFNTDAGTTLTVGGGISGTGGLTKSGTGQMTIISGVTNSFTGGVNVTGGTLFLRFQAQGTTNMISASNAVTLNSAVLTAQPFGGIYDSQTFNGVTLASGNNSITTVQGVSQTRWGTELTLGTIIRNPGTTLGADISFGDTGTKNSNIAVSNTNTNGILGPWATVLTGANTRYATVINNATTASRNTIISQHSSSNIAGTYSNAGLGYTGGADGTAATDANGFVSGTVNYGFTTTVPTTLTGPSTAYTARYSGVGGTINLGAGSNTLTLGGLLNAGTGTLTIDGTGGSGTVVVEATTNELIVNTANAAIAISAPITNNGLTAGTLIKTGSNRLTLSGANTYTGGTYLNAGVLALGSTTSSTTALGTGTLRINGGSLDSTVANLVNANNNAQTWNGNFGFVGTNSLNLGIGAVTLTDNRTVAVTASTLTVGGIIGDGGSGFGLTKSGLGTLALTGVNTFSGATNVIQGAIGGTGTIAGAVTLSSTGGIDLRDGTPATLTLGSTLDITGAAGANNLYFDLGDNTGTSDQISVAGTTTVTTTGSAVVNLNQFNGLAGRNATTYTLIGGAGTLDATNFAKFSLATTKAFGQTYALANGGTNGDLQVTATNVTSATPTAFWSGATSVNWNTASNWKNAIAGSALLVVPDYQTNVTFSATGAGNLSNTLDADFDINSLNFNAAAGGVTIGGTKMLTIEATTANSNATNNGINSANTSGTNTISAKVGVAANQTWTVARGGTLALTSLVTDFGGGRTVTLAGGGTLTLTNTTGPLSSFGLTVGDGTTFSGTAVGGIASANSQNALGNGLVTINYGGTLSTVTAAFNPTNAFTVNNGGTLNLRGAATPVGLITLNSGATLVSTTGALTLTQGTNVSFPTAGVFFNGLATASTVSNAYPTFTGTMAFGGTAAVTLTTSAPTAVNSATTLAFNQYSGLSTAGSAAGMNFNGLVLDADLKVAGSGLNWAQGAIPFGSAGSLGAITNSGTPRNIVVEMSPMGIVSVTGSSGWAATTINSGTLETGGTIGSGTLTLNGGALRITSDTSKNIAVGTNGGVIEGVNNLNNAVIRSYTGNGTTTGIVTGTSAAGLVLRTGSDRTSSGRQFDVSTANFTAFNGNITLAAANIISPIALGANSLPSGSNTIIVPSGIAFSGGITNSNHSRFITTTDSVFIPGATVDLSSGSGINKDVWVGLNGTAPTSYTLPSTGNTTTYRLVPLTTTTDITTASVFGSTNNLIFSGAPNVTDTNSNVFGSFSTGAGAASNAVTISASQAYSGTTTVTGVLRPFGYYGINNGPVTLTATNTLPNTPQIDVRLGARFTVSGGSGAVGSATVINVNGGGTFTSGDTGSSNYTRLSDSAVITLGANTGASLGGGTFAFANNTTTGTETVGSLVVSAGSNGITPSATAGVLLSFGDAAGTAYTRNAGGLLTLTVASPNVRFANAQNGTSTAIGAAGNRILVGTLLNVTSASNVPDFAVAGAGVNLVAPTYVTQNNLSLWTDDNILVSGTTSLSVAANSTINSLRFTSAQAVTLAGQLTVRSGMIVFPAVQNSAGMTISGGSLTTGNGQDLIFFDNYNGFNQIRKTISSQITGGNALTYSGNKENVNNGGYLALNNNSNVIGDIYVSAGVLESLQSGSLGATATSRTLYLLGGWISFEAGTTQSYTNTALTVGATGGQWTDSSVAASFSTTTSSFGGAVTLNGNLFVGALSNQRSGTGAKTLTGDISGPGSLRLTSTSRMTLSGNNSAWTGGMTISGGAQVRLDSANAAGAGSTPIFNGDSGAAGIGIVEFTNSFGTSLTNDLLVSAAGVSTSGTGFLISNAKTNAAVTLSGKIASNGLTFQGYDSGSAVSETVLSGKVATSGTPLTYNYGGPASGATTNFQQFINGQSGITLGVTAYAGTTAAQLAYGTSGFLAYNAGTTTGVTDGAEGYVRFSGTNSFLPGAVGPGYVAALRKGGASTLNFGYFLTGSGSGTTYTLPEGKSFVIGTLGTGAGQTGTFGATGSSTNTATFLGNPKAAAGQLLAGFNGGDINIHANAATDTATLNLSARAAGDTLVLGDGVTAANNVVITPTWGDSGATSAMTLLQKRTGLTTLKKVGAGTLEIKGVNLTHTDGTDASGVFTWDVNVGTLKLNGTGVNTTILTDGNTATTSDILISGGTLELAASEQIANTGSINMTSGAFNFGAATGLTETIDKFTNSGGTFSTGANILIGLGNTITWSGGTNTVNNGGSVQDLHIVISGGTNTVEGGATGGVLQLNSGGLGLEMSAGATLTLNSATAPAVAGKLLLSGNVSTSGDTTVTIANGGSGDNPGNIDLNNGTRTFTVADGAATTDMSISARITNTGSIIKDGAGTLSLNAENTYSGTTTITNGGTLIANVLGALPLTPRSAVSFTGTGTSALNLGANQFVASLSSAGAATVALGSNTLTVGIAGGNTTFAGSIGGTGGNLVKDTNSTQVLSGANGYTGTTTVSAGTLEVTGSLSGTTAVTVNTGGTLLMNSTASDIVKTTATVAMAGGTLAFGNAANQTQNLGAMTLTANSILDFGAGGGNDKFHFAGFVNTAGTLAITNWLGNDAGGTDGAHDRLVFTGLFTDFTSSFSQSQISFNGTSGYAAIDFGSTYEIVPVPEPATTALIGSIALCALIGYRERRRFTGLGKRTAARK